MMNKTARLNTLEFFKTIINLQSRLMSKEQTEELENDSALFDYYKRSILSFIISRDQLSSTFVDIPAELFYNLEDLKKLRTKYIVDNDLMYEEFSSDISA